MDYKSTLNLPKTSFAMKANLPQTEPAILERWDRERLYAQMLGRPSPQGTFLLHDGPPYANGDIHMGHALNKVLKDIIVRFESFQGKRVPFVPGWDCHGLPIEYALMKELKVTKHQVDVVEFRKAAREYARKFVRIQREQFKRLGCIGDWERPYLTLEPGYAGAALRALGRLVEKGYVYRDRRPVNWCWSCETALAEAEVEYEPHTSPSVFVKFELTPGSVKRLRLPADRDITGVFLIIWTTTPWTLMGNVAVAVHPEYEYAWRRVGPNERWLTLAKLPESMQQELAGAATSWKLEEVVRGKSLEGLEYRHPLIPRTGKVVLADYVSAEEGTGLVHTAPGFGAEDYLTGKKYGLEVLAPVDAKGQFAGLPKEAARFNGRQVQQANEGIVRWLKESGHLIREGRIGHTYPHCWRCHTPIIFRATDQWFLRVEHDRLRDRLLEAVEAQVRWIPPEGKERMIGMLKSRPDWCLSRQRLWGIPIPAVICRKCGEGMLDPRVIEAFARAVEAEPAGSDRWFTEPVTRWLPAGPACRCGAREWERGTDILDVWFDSGVSHQAMLARWEGLSVPADLYLEGSDQHRGWFQVSLITALALTGQAPYRSVLTHGFVVDGEGRKMSKSLGNVIAPQEVIARYGADVLRLWVASSDYREDVRLSSKILTQVAEVYRKIRNTLRFCLANIGDFDPAAMTVPPARMEELDRWILCQLSRLVEEVTDSYRASSFHRVSKAVHEFCTVQLSNVYLDVIKDRLYASAQDDPRRRSAQTALFEIARALVLCTAPILPATAEEAWSSLPPSVRRTEGASGPSYQGVHLQAWPDAGRIPRDEQAEGVWNRLLALRDQAMKALEEMREGGRIGDALEAELEIRTGNEGMDGLLRARLNDFADACVVSAVRLGGSRAGAGAGAAALRVEKAAGAKCQRCWKRLPTVGRSEEHPTLCERCVGVVRMWYTHRLK